MKRIMAALTALIVAVLFAAGADAASGVEVYLDGAKQDFTVSMEVLDGVEMVPLRPILEMCGYTVDWDNERQWVYCTSARGKFLISIGARVVMNNNYSGPYIPSKSPMLLNNVTVIPKDFAEYLTGTSIEYSSELNSLSVMTSSGGEGSVRLEGIGGWLV